MAGPGCPREQGREGAGGTQPLPGKEAVVFVSGRRGNPARQLLLHHCLSLPEGHAVLLKKELLCWESYKLARVYQVTGHKPVEGLWV